MKTLKLNFIFLIFSILLISCVNKYDKKTKLFNTYLIDNFNDQILNEKQIYFVIPAINCEGCVDFLLNELKTSDLKANLIITYDYQDYLPPNINVLIDTKKNIDRINLGISNTYIIITKEKQIKNILQITPENFTDIYQTLTE